MLQPSDAAGTLHTLVLQSQSSTGLVVAPGTINRASGAVTTVGPGVTFHPDAFGLCDFVLRAAPPTAYIGQDVSYSAAGNFVFHTISIDAGSGRMIGNVTEGGPGWAAVSSSWDDATGSLVSAGFLQPTGTQIDIVSEDVTNGTMTVLEPAIRVEGIQVCEGAFFPGPNGVLDGVFFFLTISGVTEVLVSFDMAQRKAHEIPLVNVDGIVTGYSGITAYTPPGSGRTLLAALVYNGVAVGPTEVVLVDPAAAGNVTRIARAPDLCYAPAQGSPAVDSATDTFFFLLLHYAPKPGGGCVDGAGAPASLVLVEVNLVHGGWSAVNVTGVTVNPQVGIPLVSLDWVPA